MKNYVQPGKTITLAAPYAVSAGDGLLVGAIFGVATASAAIGEAVESALVGVFDLRRPHPRHGPSATKSTGTIRRRRPPKQRPAIR